MNTSLKNTKSIYNSINNILFMLLKICTWGIPYISKNYEARIAAISKRLFKEQKYDVICLQEIWIKEDFELFQLEAKDTYPFSHYFYSGVIGSGVCVFSKWPIVEVLFHKWQVNGYIHKITHGDWYGGKGIGLCRLKANEFKINIYTCHTHAVYNRDTEYIAHRVVQSYDIAQFIRISTQDADLAILAADLNTEPEGLCYRIINNYGELIDSFNAKINKADAKGTYDCSKNSYSCIKNSTTNPDGRRLDFIFYKIGKDISVECVLYCTPLEIRISDEKFSYSDHEAISACFKLDRKINSGDSSCNARDISPRVKALEDSMAEGIWICEKAVKELKKDLNKIKIFMFISTALLVCLFSVVIFFYHFPVGQTVFIFFIVLTVVLLFYEMIDIWKRMELNGILCALSGMKITTNAFKEKS